MIAGRTVRCLEGDEMIIPGWKIVRADEWYSIRRDLHKMQRVNDQWYMPLDTRALGTALADQSAKHKAVVDALVVANQAACHALKVAIEGDHLPEGRREIVQMALLDMPLSREDGRNE